MEDAGASLRRLSGALVHWCWSCSTLIGFLYRSKTCEDWVRNYVIVIFLTQIWSIWSINKTIGSEIYSYFCFIFIVRYLYVFSQPDPASRNTVLHVVSHAILPSLYPRQGNTRNTSRRNRRVWSTCQNVDLWEISDLVNFTECIYIKRDSRSGNTSKILVNSMALSLWKHQQPCSFQKYVENAVQFDSRGKTQYVNKKFHKKLKFCWEIREEILKKYEKKMKIEKYFENAGQFELSRNKKFHSKLQLIWNLWKNIEKIRKKMEI